MPRTRDVAVAAAAVVVAMAVWQYGGWASASTVRWVNDVLLILVAIPPVVFAAAAARATQGRMRTGWTAMAVGIGCWMVGQVVYAAMDIVLPKAPYPSIADVFYLMYPIGVGVALLLLWNRRGSRSHGRILLDGLIVAGSLFAVSWLTVMYRFYESSHTSGIELTVLMGYPALDAVVLTISATVLVNASAAQRRPITLLTLGLVCMWVTNNAYAYLSLQDGYTAGDLLDLGWTAGMMFFTVAAAAGRAVVVEDPALDELPGWASVWLPYLPLMLAAAVMGGSPVGRVLSTPVITVGVILVVAVLLRQFLVVDQNRRLLASVADQALHDPLTGLANRTLFAQRLSAALADGRSAVAVIVIDLDDFKLTNDTLGHAAGDELLIGVGQRIAASVRSGDVVARLGGDEFAVLMTGGGTEFESTAQRILRAFDRSIVVEGHRLLMRPSLGLSVADPTQSPPLAEELLKQADVAMYAAKRSPQSRIRVFDEDLARGRDAKARPAPDRRGAGAPETVALFGQLRRAIENKELTLVYLPKLVLASRQMLAVEALLRWPHPERGLLLPDEFLPLVRRHGLTGAVTDLVLNQALDDLRTWRAAGLDLGVAINLFPPSLGMAELPQRIDEALSARGLDAAALTVEITEDLVLGDVELARQVLTELRVRGVTVSIDDFGSGYSALWYLRDLPVDEMKLDRHFIAPIAVDPRAAAVVRAVIDLARVLGIATVAEGVEDAATADVLRRYGCDMVQGYYFSPPVSAAEVLELGLGAAFGVAASTAPLPL